MNTLHDALCQRIARAARVLRESPLRGEPLAMAADCLEEAMTAVEEHRLDKASVALAKLEEVRL